MLRRHGGWLLAAAVLACATVFLKKSLSVETGASDPGANARPDPRVQEFWGHYRRASQSRAAGQLEDAIRSYDLALALRPRHEDALYYRANCVFDLGRREDAIRTYEKLVEVNPLGSSRGYMQLGLVHAAIDDGAPLDLARARREFERALAVDPDSGAVLALGEVALVAREWPEARERLRAADAGDPMSVAAPYLLGFLAWRSGGGEQAWTEFRRAVTRAEIKKPAVKWTEEGDVKADPALRWNALARQTVTGAYWLRVRRFLAPPGPKRADMEAEYRSLDGTLSALKNASRAVSTGDAARR
jgi:tetratricopeptide (TPR) repeat protein